MTVSSFSNSAVLASPQATAIDYELVRGTEDRVYAELLPRVRQESLALDLSQVERIDAAGIAALITLYCTAVEAGNSFFVVDPSLRVLELLRLVGLDSILIQESDSSAQNQVRPDNVVYFDRSAA